MKKKGLLVGSIIWALVAIAILTLIVLGMTGNLNIPGFIEGGSFAAFGSSAKLVKEESFGIEDIDKLDIITRHQDIVINLVSGDEMTVRQYEIDDQNPFTATRDGKSLRIEIGKRNISVFFVFNYSPRLEIDLPAKYADAISLESSSGTVRCADATPEWAATVIQTGSGSIRFSEGISCAGLQLSTGSGTIRFGDVEAAQLESSSNSGSQKFENIRAEGAVQMKSGSGTVNLGSVSAGGALTVTSGSGTVRSEGIAAESVDVETGSGTIRLGAISAEGRVTLESGSGGQHTGYIECGSYEIKSNSGTLRFEGLSGSGSIKNGSGGVNCDSLRVKGACSITTGSGTVRVELADDPSFELSVSTGSGTIRAGDIDLYYKNQRGNAAIGTVGDGSGGTLEISTGSGGIKIGD